MTSDFSQPTSDSPKVLLVAGTRPEAVKLATVASAMGRHDLDPVIVDSGQQPGRVAEALAPFALRPDVVLAITRESGELNELISHVATSFDAFLVAAKPAAVMVQGDTTTAMVAALASHMRGVPVIHLEAGLRTGDTNNPFPEETNRMLISDLAKLHLAPTQRASEALVREGHPLEEIVVTGNTVVDALDVLLPRAKEQGARAWDKEPRLVVTVHRREAWGDGIRTVARSIRRLIASNPTLHVIVVTHPNPTVAGTLRSELDREERCEILPPQPYDKMLALLSSADLVVTDSGGIQEEAPSLGIPAIVTRWVTERPEGVEGGWADLVGLDEDAIVTAATRRLNSLSSRPARENPYGDGRASERAAQATAWLLGQEERPGDWAGAPVRAA